MKSIALLYFQVCLLLVLRQCVCSTVSTKKTCNIFKGIVTCKRLNLKQPPEDIPNAIVELDLSENPELVIPFRYFEKRSVTTLTLSKCNIKRAFLLPKGLLHLRLNRNLLSTKEVNKMILGSANKLLTLDLSYNKLDDNLSFLQDAISLKEFIFSGNTIDILTSYHAKFLKNVLSFIASKVGMKEIKEDAFHGMARLEKLDLSANQLSQVKESTFKDCKMLSEVLLNMNALEDFPDLSGLPYYVEKLEFSRNKITSLTKLAASKIGLVTFLHLQENKIQSIPRDLFRNLKVTVTINLSKNNITSLEAYSFRNITSVGYIFLNQNPIRQVSPYAFTGIKFVSGGIFLFMSKIQELHGGLFSDMVVNTILLHSSNISSIKRAFRGIRKDPKELVLYDNKLKHVTPEFVEGLTPKCNLLISCKTLKDLNLADLRGIPLKCSPLTSYSVKPLDKSGAITLMNGGFQCEQISKTSFTCTPCPTGSYNAGGKVCTLCPAGKFYQDEIGQDYCKNCSRGQYVFPPGGNSVLSCITCPINTNTNDSAGTRACYCLPGFARKDRFGKCEPCNRVGIKCLRDFEELKPEYWWFFRTKKIKKEYVCFTDSLLEHELGYDRNCTKFSMKKPKAYKCPIKGACLGGVLALCTQNYTGVLCDVCNNGYYRHLKRCVKCPKPVEAIVRIVFVIVIFFSICILLGWADKQKLPSERRTLADVILSTLKIVLNFYQTLSIILILLADISWPRSLLRFSYICRYLEMRVFSIGSMNCVFPNIEFTIIHELVLSLGATIGFPFLLFIFLWINLCCVSKKHNCEHTSVRIKKVVYRYISIFLFATYSITSARVFMMLPAGCLTLCSDEEEQYCVSYVRADVRVKCDDASTKKYVYLAYCGLLIPFGYPIIMLLLVRKFKKPSVDDTNMLDYREMPDYLYTMEIQDEEDLDEELVDERTSREQLIANEFNVNEGNKTLPVEFAIRFFYENYKPSVWYWELVEILKKLMITFALAVFGSDTRTNLGVFIALSGSSAVAYAWMQPIKDLIEHRLQMLATTVIFLNSVAAILLNKSSTMRSTSGSSSDEKGLGIILMILNLSIIAAFIVRLLFGVVVIAKKWKEKRKNKRKQRKSNRFLQNITLCFEFLRNFKHTKDFQHLH